MLHIADFYQWMDMLALLLISEGGMSHSFIAYIDESGDDGIAKFREPGRGGASHWLTLATCLVSVANDPLIPSWRNSVTQTFRHSKRKDIHFADLDHEQRVFVCEHLAKLPLRFAAVMSNKTTIPTHPRKDLFREKNTLYQYLCRYLIERISAYAKRRANQTLGDGRVKIIFSRRGGMSYDAFRTYLYRLQELNEPGIHWDHIDIESVDAMDHKQRAGLQFADVVASAFSAAIEPNYYGGFEPRYAQLLAPRVMLTADGLHLGCGVKPVPRLSQMVLAPEQREFFDWFGKKIGRPLAPVPSPLSATATQG